MIDKQLIGKNIREVRLEQGLSQEKLAQKCGFSNTTLSSYETSRKNPNLETASIIAKALNVSIERLCYGDENNAFISSVSDEGRKIVNAIYYLWDTGVIGNCCNYSSDGSESIYCYDFNNQSQPSGLMVKINKYYESIGRLISFLNNYKKNKMTYDKPEEYLEMTLSSVANEINEIIKRQNNMS